MATARAPKIWDGLGLDAIDSREPDKLAKLVQQVVVPAPIIALPSGDFRFIDKCGHSLGIERKEANDLLASLAKEQNDDKRLFDQIKRMIAEYDYQILLIEGGFRMNPLSKKVITARRQTGWLYVSVWALVLDVAASGVAVMPSDNHITTAEIVRILHNRATRGCIWPSPLNARNEDV